VEEAGLVKFDFLGLKTLTVIDLAVGMIRKERPDFDLRAIPLDDAAVYRMISDGDTTGVFQLESSGFKELLKKLRPDCFEDIIAAGALYRPGPLEGGMVDDFINRKHGRTRIVYHHPAMEPILKETYGVIVYQEQVMQIARALAGYTLGGADLLRRAMGKKKKEVMEQEKARFLEGARKTGVDERVADEVFELMAAFAGYGFNKSHSAAYGLVTYQTAYLKHHYPEEFMAALLTCDKDDTDKVAKNVAEIRAMGIRVLPPDVNQSAMDFTVVKVAAAEKAIRFGLSAIKGVGETAVQAILEARAAGGRYTSLFSLCERVDLRRVNKKVLEALIKSGALDEVVPSRAQAMAALDVAVDRAQKAQRERESGQTSLFGLLEGPAGGGSGAGPEPPYPTLDEWSPKQRLQSEKESLGFYISGHPLDRYLPDLARARALRTDELEGKEERTEVAVGGIVSDFRERPLKSGTGRMCFFNLEDPFGRVEVICFSKPFGEYEEVLKGDDPILVVGTLVTEGDGPVEAQQRKIHLKEAIPLPRLRLMRTQKVVVEMPADELSRDKLKALQQVLRRHHGGVQMALKLRQPQRWAVEALLPSHYRVVPSDELLQSLESLVGPASVRLC
jgi:DNA polymerase-3 subunit alpha